MQIPESSVDVELPEELIQSSQEIRLESSKAIEDKQQMVQPTELVQEEVTKRTIKTVKVRTETNKKWGPVLVEERPRRQAQGGKSMLARAQELKMKQNLELLKGKTKNTNPFSILSVSEFSNIASIINVNLGDDEAANSKILRELVDVDASRNKVFTETCSFKLCSDKVDNVEEDNNLDSHNGKSGDTMGEALVVENVGSSGQWDQIAPATNEIMSWNNLRNS